MKQASNNGVEHSTHGDAGTLSSAAQQRNAKNLQRCNDVEHNSKHDKVYEHNSEATRQRNAKNIQHQQHDATRM